MRHNRLYTLTLQRNFIQKNEDIEKTGFFAVSVLESVVFVTG